MNLYFTAFLAVPLGFASAQTPSPIPAEASSLPSGSSMPSSTPTGSPSVLETPSPLPPSSQRIVTIIANSAIHANLDAALEAIDFIALNAAGVTLLAPTDTAFGNMVAKTGTLFADLFMDDFHKHLECFVLSHVLSGVLTENVLAQKPAVYTSLSGFDVAVTTTGGVVHAAGVPLAVTNVAASNGVIHFLNTLPILAPCVNSSILDIVQESFEFSVSADKIATSTAVSTVLGATPPITVLLPSNDAWAKLPIGVANYIYGNATALEIVLKNHILSGIHYFDGEGPLNNTFTTSAGARITITRVTSGPLRVQGQKYLGVARNLQFERMDNLARNGVFHVINEVIIPPSLPFPFIIICFPGDATVEVKGAGKTDMKNLKIGDEVLTSAGTYDKVYGFGHNQPDAIGEYIEISTKETSKPLQLSRDHMLFVDSGNAVPARSLKVGDEILLESGKKGGITKISTVLSTGAFAPFTESGSIVVNGVVASSYIAMDDEHDMLTLGGIELPISYQWMSHASQAPHRVYCRMFDCTSETYDADGVSEWVAGPYSAGRFLLEQNMLVQLLAFLVLMPLFTLCAGLDVILNSPVAVATGVVGVYSLSSMFKIRLTSSK